MRHIYEQSNRDGGGSTLRGRDLDLVEAVEDHHANDEAPEDHCLDEEGCGNSPRPRLRTTRQTALTRLGLYNDAIVPDNLNNLVCTQNYQWDACDRLVRWEDFQIASDPRGPPLFTVLQPQEHKASAE